MSEEYYPGYTSISSYIRNRNKNCSFREFVDLYQEMIIESPPNTDNWNGLETAWETRFLRRVEEIIPEKYDDIYAKVKSETSNKSLMDYWQNIVIGKGQKSVINNHISGSLKILDASANHNTNKIVSEISNLYEDQEIPELDTDALLSRKRSRIQQEEPAKENIFQENLLDSVAEASDTFSKVTFPTYYDKLKYLWHVNDPEANYYVIDLGIMRC